MSGEKIRFMANDDFYDQIASCYDDPLRFVLWAFPWGETPELSMVRLPEPWASKYPDCKYGPDKWACEVLDYVGQRVRENAFDGVHAVKPIQLAVASGHGIGKLQTVDCIVDTPDGKRRWGDLKPGDRLFGSDGKPTTIIAIPYRGVRPCYRVTFDDGSSTIVGQEHLWTVRGRQERRKGLSTWRTLETQEILKLGVKRSNGKAMARQWEIPRQEAIVLPEADLPANPYVFGMYLGNGVVNSSKIILRDCEAQWEATCKGKADVRITEYKDGRKCSIVVVHGLLEAARLVGLKDCHSYEKYIPDVYKYSSAEQRSELLRGLLDTDGTAGKHGSVTYSTTSRRLADDVIWLVRSLGGKAQLQPTVKKPWYTDTDGTKVNCRDCYNITLRMPDGFKYGYVGRKWDRVNSRSQERYLKRWIESIEPVGEREGMCVTVDRTDGLYLANDFIVTHNSFLTACLVIWIMATRPGAKGAVTANTASQLETKTFAEISKWLKRSLVRDMFDIKASAVVQKDEPESWRVDALTCREENSEAFAGQHAAASTSFYIFDEASAVPDKIWEVAEGGLTDGEPMWFVFGNPTRNTGRFKECFGRFRDLWKTFQVDSREVQITNKEQIGAWAKEYGEDSDFFRVRVRGLFPNAASTQFIPTKLAEDAMARQAPMRHHIGTAILGVDVARFGDDDTVIATRFGKDGTTPLERFHGLSGDRVIALVKARINALYRQGFERVYVFIDEGGLGGAIVDVLRADGFREVRGVNFGQSADNPELYPRKREEMWARMRKWLEIGALPDDQQLLDDLTGVEFEYDIEGRPKLERKEDMKKRGLHSPDSADALSLTFAFQVREVTERDVGPQRETRPTERESFNPLDLRFCTRR